MKTGISLTQLAETIERNRDLKKDFVTSTKQMIMAPRSTGLNLVVGDNVNSNPWESDAYNITDTTHRQIGERIGIPAKYYDRMREADADLLCTNVSRWFNLEPQPRMVRTMDGTARAFLSDRYHRIEHEQVAEAILPVLMETPGLRIESCQITETRMYIKAVNERCEMDVKVGDSVQSGVVIKNSEVGFGAYSVEPLVFRLICLNGMIVNDAKFKRNHIGGTLPEGVLAAITDETMEATDKAIQLTARDVVKHALSEAILQQQVDKMREAAGDPIKGDPVKAVEVLAKVKRLTDGEGTGILRELINGADLSRYGLLNAVTRHAQDVENYDRSTELEALGGSILDLPRTEWRAMAEAA